MYMAFEVEKMCSHAPQNKGKRERFLIQLSLLIDGCVVQLRETKNKYDLWLRVFEIISVDILVE